MSNKPGRNDPCPCGSGKKYKKCCGSGTGPDQLQDFAQNMFGFSSGTHGEDDMEDAFKRYQAYVESGQADRDGHPSFMQFMGRSNAATAVTAGLGKSLDGKAFSSEAELHSFMDGVMKDRNSAPQKDFLGLSSARMHRILSCKSFSGLADIVRFSDAPFSALAGNARIVRILRFLLESHNANNGELPLTEAGNYKPALVKEVVSRYYTETEFEASAKKETDVRTIALAHDFLVFRGYAAELKTKSRLTDKGRALAAEQDESVLWKEFFTYFAYDAEWLEFTREEMNLPFFSLIQDAALFSLYMLLQGEAWITPQEAYGQFRTAFPSFDPESGKREVNLGEILYRVLFIDFFCAETGLVEFETASIQDMMLGKRRFRASPLLKAALAWKV